MLNTHIGKWYWLLSMLVATPNFASASANSADLNGIQESIQANNARWTAGETSMSGLSDEEKKHRLGALVDKSAATLSYTNSIYTDAVANAVALPAAFDWRNYNGQNFVTPVRDQGQCGSCWAFSSTAVLEAKALITLNQPNTDLNLAEQTLVSCSGAGSCNGGYMNKAADFLLKSGTGAEATFPYTRTNNACSAATANWQANAYKIKDWHYVSSYATVSADAIKNAIYNSGPLVISMTVYNDFYSYKSGVYSVVSGSALGGHAVTVVGWDDSAKAFIVKNSWGTGWGDKGYFKIAYTELYGGSGKAKFGSEVLAYGSVVVGGGTPCLYTLAPGSQSALAAGMSGTVSVSNVSACAWKATSNATWITITTGNSGSGNGAVAYTVAANTGGAARSGTITVGDQTFTVTQAGTAGSTPVCSLTTSTNTLSAGASAVLTASCKPAAKSYAWTATIGTATTALQLQSATETFASDGSASTYSGKVTPKETTTFAVVATNSAGNGAAVNTKVTVAGATRAPVCSLVATPSVIAKGASSTLTATCNPGATSYTWTNSGFAGTVGGGNVTPTATTTYSVIGKNAAGSGNSAAATVTITGAAATPKCVLTATPAVISAGGSTTLAVVCSPAATSYTWTNTGFGATTSSGKATPGATTTYSVVGIAGGVRSDKMSVTVTVNSLTPLTPTVLITPSGTITTKTPTFSWNASANATYYKLSLRRSTDTLDSWIALPASALGCGTGSGTCSATISSSTPLTSQTTYVWYVKAMNASGESAASVSKTFLVNAK